MYKLFIGSDMSKDKFDLSYYYNGEILYLGEFVNTINGYHKMLRLLKRSTNIKPIDWFVCFENTGVYSKQFLHWLLSKNISCLEENPIQISNSMGLRRGKNDKIDSKSICRYAYEKRDFLKKSTIPKQSLSKLKSIIARRKLLDKHRSSLRVSLGEQKNTMDPDLFKQMQKSNKAILELLNKDIKDLDKKMKEIMESNDEIKKNAALCQTVVGIGPLTAAMILIRTNNFEDISDGRKLSCYCGTAPFSNSSGKFIGKSRVSKYGDKYLKAILSNGAQNAIRFDKEIKHYYERKIAEGKAYGSVMNAIKNKLLHRVCAVIKRQTPYVKIMQYT